MTQEESHFDIRGVDPSNINSLSEIDETIFAVEKSIATIETQLDFETEGGTKPLRQERKEWYFKARGANRFAKATLRALQARRELLWDAADQGVENEV